MRLVTGDDQVACWMCDGWNNDPPSASGVSSAPPPPLIADALYCSDQYRLILLRGVACQVMRAMPLRSGPSEKAGRLRSKSTTQEFGLPAFLLKNIPGILFRPSVCR